MLSQVTQAYDAGVATLGTPANAGALINQALGVGPLPLLNQSLSQYSNLQLSADLLTPFKTALTQNTEDWTKVENQLLSAGFSIAVPFTGSPDSNNNLLEVNWTNTFNSTDPIQILGDTGLKYLDGAGGGLYGGIVATGVVTVSLTMGVDVNATTQQLGFFVLPGSNVVQANLSGSTAPSGLSGTLAIGDLANVSATATGKISFSGALSLSATSSDLDGKLRVTDLTNQLSQAVTGGVSGTASVDVSQFSAHLFGLPAIKWSGVISDSVLNNTIGPESDALNEPSPQSLLSLLGTSLFSLGGDIPVLGTLSNTLNQPLPLIGQSIAQLTGLDQYIPTLPSLPAGFSSLNGTYDLAGGTLTVDVTPSTIDQFLHGQGPSLVSWQTSGNLTLLRKTYTVPIFSFGVPDIASVNIDATFGLYASLEYHIGFGLDGHGFYALAGTPADPTLGLSFGVTAGVQGQVDVFGFPLAEAGGNIGFSITPYVALAPAPPNVDPTASTGKVYMSDLALFGKDPVSDLMDDLSVGIVGAFTGELYASVHLFFFSVGWHWGISIPVFNYERLPTWPGLPGGGPGATSWPNVTQHGGVVTFDGTSSPDNVSLTQGDNNSLTVGWVNAPAGSATSETFTGVTSFVFNGGSGADTLTAAPGLTTPVRAVGGSGNDTFDLRNSSANNTLVAGTASNTLDGGSGNDLIIGGKGTDSLTAGSGTDTLFGGSGDATVTLGSGHDGFYGGNGNYDIVGGSGTYVIDGGGGSDVISAGSGSHDTIYAGAAGQNQITGSTGGYDTIYGGGAGDTITGGGGFETIYGSGGSLPGTITDSTIIGGPLGDNTIFGGGGGDFLAGGIGGHNTIYAGMGNETLNGGDGIGLVVNPIGNGLLDSAGDGLSPGFNTLIGGSGNDTLYGDSASKKANPNAGPNLLQAGTGNDTLYAGAYGDSLIAGLGTDALYGSNGNDTFQLPFTPVGQVQPNDTLVGGGGRDTLVLKAVTGTGTANPDVTASAIPDATTTSITVSNGLPIAADLPGDGSGLVIQLGSEQMLVTAVNGNVLTVERGYNGTTAGPHGDNALVLLPDNGSPTPAPSDYQLYLNHGSTSSQYVATLSTLRFATETANGTTVTGIDSTAGLAVGQAVAGPGIPAGTTIAAIPSSTTLTLSNQATLSQGNLPLTFGTIGSVAFALPGDISNIQLEAGPGNNLIQVDPSVKRDLTIYGGPGYNVLMAGSGNDTLVAGPGTAVLYGGTGQDTLYGGDLPTQDIPPTAGSDPALTVTNNPNPVEGNDTLIAGPGNDQLFAGSGNVLLIGGSVARLAGAVAGTPGVAALQNSQFQLIEGAGQDILTGGSGNDVLIAGPGSPGAILEAGSGNNTLIAQNYGVNTLIGGSTGHSLLLGGNLENFEVSNSAAGGGNTLVGGLGVDNLLAGSGNDVLYASYDATAWSQGEATAAAVGVHVVPPQLFQGDQTASQIQVLLEAEQTQQGGLTVYQLNQLYPLISAELSAFQTSADASLKFLETELDTPNLAQSPALEDQLSNQKAQTSNAIVELGTMVNMIPVTSANTTQVPQLLEDSLVGGSGNDTFYGNVQNTTWMGGGSGNDVFYNYNPSDNIHGGSGSNTLVLQDNPGNNTITLSQDATNVNAVDFTDNGTTLPIGDTGNVSGIQTLELQLGSGNDSVTVSLPPRRGLPSGLTGLSVLSGTGNDTIDASTFQGNETLAGGSGNDVIRVGAVLGSTSDLIGTPTTELDLEDTTSLPVTLGQLENSIVPLGLKVGSFTESLQQLGSFGKLVVVGGPGDNNFTMDGSIPDVELEGGSGLNTFNVSGGTATLIGGSGSNTFDLEGPGNYTIQGAGPVIGPAAPATAGVTAPASLETYVDSGSRDGAAVATVGNYAIFAGGIDAAGNPSPAVDIFDASTDSFVKNPPQLSAASYDVAVHSGVDCGCTATSARTRTATEGFASAFATSFSS